MLSALVRTWLIMIITEEAIGKCMQLAPAFNLAHIISDTHNQPRDPFKSLQFSNLDNLVSLWRSKRDTGRSKRETGLVNVDEDDFVEFLDDVAEYKGDMAAKMGNLSCVLVEMKMLTPDQKVSDLRDILTLPSTSLCPDQYRGVPQRRH